MAEFWENVSIAIEEIKTFVIGFYEIVMIIWSYIPEPFSSILKISTLVILALIASKIVRR